MSEVTTMLSEFLAVTTLVVTDVDLAKPFYEEQLGLTLLLVGARGFEPPVSTPRIVLPGWIDEGLRRVA